MSTIKSAARRTTPSYSKRVYVQQSSIGLGVFAAVRFQRYATVGRVTGRVIRDPTYESSYCIDLGESSVLEPNEPWRYLNHSCHPNCELVTWEDEPEGRMWLTARRKIEPGEELTIDYAWPAEAAIPCACGSPRCRGWVVDRRELVYLERNRRKK